jgi:hypothetical protein
VFIGQIVKEGMLPKDFGEVFFFHDESPLWLNRRGRKERRGSFLEKIVLPATLSAYSALSAVIFF